nr:divergent polysaccharide deacetylase family protein [Enterovibrio coralii]
MFLDHFPNEAFILSQLELAIQQAKKRGTAVVIAHPLPVTLDTLKAVLPKIQEQVELVPISAALRQ